MSTQDVELRRGDGSYVQGTLHDELKPEHLLLIERQWSTARADLMAAFRRLGVPRREWPQSLHWNWGHKASDLELIEAAGYAVECEGRWQGAMLTKTVLQASRVASTLGRPIVYVDYLEVAPWNWRVALTGQTPVFKGVGALLFREAVLQSIREEFEGRVGLHSLPQAEQFYRERCGMDALGMDAFGTDVKLVYFELTREGARRFLNGG